MHGDDTKSIPKLQADGSNWVMYRDHLTLALETNGLDTHITNDAAPSEYVAAGTIGNLDAATRWKRGEAMTKHLIASTVPNSVFNQVKGGTSAKAVWEKLKSIYEERSRAIRVDPLRRAR